MSVTRTIYGLVDVREPGAIRYVGQTSHPRWQRRVDSHRTKARSGCQYPVSLWVASVLAGGGNIRGVVIEGFADEDAEARYIESLRAAGVDLLNVRSGGLCGDHFPEAYLARMSASQIAAKASPVVRERMRQAGLRAQRRPEVRAKRQGENNASAKLTTEGVVSIRTAYARGGVSQSALARQHGVTQTLIGQVVRRQIWSHVP